MFRRHRYVVFLGALIAAQVLFQRESIAETVAVDATLLQQMQELIQQQQRQLDEVMKQQEEQRKEHAEQLKALQQQVEDLKKTSTEAQTIATEAQSTATEAQTTATEAQTTAARAIDTAEQTSAGQLPDKVVTSGQDRIKLAISGQVNRATNIIADGDNTKAYFVDNDASNTRFRFVGTGKITDDLTLGSRLEIALTANESSDVSQDNEASDDFVDARWAEFTFDSKRFGKLSIGQGDTASNNTSEVDLSKTDVVQYSSIADIAGGMQFRDKDDELTGVTVSDAFSNLDGLSRQSRVRYDTPSFYGFRLASSVVTDDRWDAALFWGGQGYGFKFGAAGAVVETNRDDINLQYNGSASILHEDTGLNLTLSGGFRDKDDGGNPTNLWGKVGWIGDLFSFGPTAFAVDYDRSVNFPTGGDDGYSFGVAAVQHLDDFGTEIYLQYRVYSLDRGAADNVHEIHVGTVGARVKF